MLDATAVSRCKLICYCVCAELLKILLPYGEHISHLYLLLEVLLHCRRASLTMMTFDMPHRDLMHDHPYISLINCILSMPPCPACIPRWSGMLVLLHLGSPQLHAIC